MTASRLKAFECAVPSTEPAQSVRRPSAFNMKLLLFGPNGLRSGWRLLIFIGLLAFCSAEPPSWATAGRMASGMRTRMWVKSW
jgi:hypothetical protein